MKLNLIGRQSLKDDLEHYPVGKIAKKESVKELALL